LIPDECEWLTDLSQQLGQARPGQVGNEAALLQAVGGGVCRQWCPAVCVTSSTALGVPSGLWRFGFLQT
jgi:hypothetical protein